MLHYIPIVILLIFSNSPEVSHELPVSLCKALINTDIGDRNPVIVSGVYSSHFFYDPEEPTCQLLDEGTAFVEFSDTEQIDERFWALRKKDNRVYATFRAVLHGPEFEPEAKYPDLPEAARLAAIGRGRYGPYHDRTKLVVEEVLDFSPVPDQVPWPDSISRESFPLDPQMPAAMQFPSYPRAARTLDLEGTAILNAIVEAGAVTEVRIKFGDPILVEEAVANIKTWEFPPETTTEFDVEYVFRLERRPLDQSFNPTYILRLPSYIEVVGAKRIW